MNKKIIKLFSLLLVIVMALASCSPKEAVNEDSPVTAEGVLNNFFTFNKKEAKSLSSAVHLNDELGQTYDYCDDYAIFLKETKDRFNNLTETYSVYSVEEKKVVFTISNTYADEWGWEDDFGNETYPEKVIDEIDIVDDYGIIYFAVTWIAYTPIDEEIIEEEELEWSYTEHEYYEFYDVKGKLIAKSSVEDWGEEIDSNDYCTVVSFGRTVAVFDNEDSTVISKHDGDKESTPMLYDFMNDKYNYLFNVPASGVSPDINPILSMYRTKIQVYDKKGNLVLDYAHGDYAIMRNAEVLQSGDILLQNISITDEIDYDFFLDGQTVNIDTFIIDVETGTLTELADFGYMIDGVYFAEDILLETDDYKFTDNVRNIAYARSLADEKSYTIFFDNFGNVNFVFDGKLTHEIEEDPNLYAPQCTVLRKDRLLVNLESGVSEKAIIDNSGKVIAYVNDNCIILNDYIVSINQDLTVDVYDFDMKFVRTVDSHWADSYKNSNDSVEFCGTIGNTVLFAVTDVSTGSNSGTTTKQYIVRVSAKTGNTESMSDCTMASVSGAEANGFVIIQKESKNSPTPIFLLVNENNRVVLTVSAYSAEIVYSEEGVALIVFETSNGTECYLLDNGGIDDEEKEDPNKNPEKDPEEDPDNDDEDEDDKDEGGKK